MEISQSSNTSLNLLLEYSLTGQNVSYSADCSYFDDNSQSIQTCNASVNDNSQIVTNNFLVDFVTSERQILKTFQLGDFQFIFDDQSNLNIFFTKDYFDDLDEHNGDALQLIENTLGNEVFLFGCNITQFVKIIFIRTIQNIDYYDMIYQCKIKKKNVLRAVIISIDNHYEIPSFPHFTNSMDISNILIYRNYKITIYMYSIFGGAFNSLPLIDAEVVLNSVNITQKVISCTMIAIYENMGSYFNQLTQYLVYISRENGVHTYIVESEKYSTFLNDETFNIISITLVPNSTLAFIVDQDIGGYFWDIQVKSFLQVIKIKDYDTYYHQDLINQNTYLGFNNELKVYKVVGNWPYTLHFITSYGIFYFDFPVDLSNKTAVMKDPENNLLPMTTRMIRTSFDQFSDQVVANNQGYVFLVKQSTGIQAFDIYLGSVSFYSNYNSRLFQSTYITSNIDCFSMNLQNSSQSGSGQVDEIAVSFVCGTQLLRRGISMKPHLLLNFQKFPDVMTYETNSALTSKGGKMDYNQFNVQVVATNKYSSNFTLVKISIHSSSISVDSIYYIGIIILLFAVMIVISCFIQIFNRFSKNFFTMITQGDYKKKIEMSPVFKLERIDELSSDSDKNRDRSLEGNLSNDSREANSGQIFKIKDDYIEFQDFTPNLPQMLKNLE